MTAAKRKVKELFFITIHFDGIKHKSENAINGNKYVFDDVTKWDGKKFNAIWCRDQIHFVIE